jgi:hypothetical protein
MKPFDTVTWQALLIGLCYAIFVGGFFIKLAIRRMYYLVDPKDERQSLTKWQPPLVGVIERALYIVSLMAGYAGFIGLWVGLKVGIPYLRWSEGAGKPEISRALFINSLYGNALSILYAVVGFQSIIWFDKAEYERMWFATVVLIVFNMLIWLYLFLTKRPILRD